MKEVNSWRDYDFPKAMLIAAANLINVHKEEAIIFYQIGLMLYQVSMTWFKRDELGKTNKTSNGLIFL